MDAFKAGRLKVSYCEYITNATACQVRAAKNKKKFLL